MKKYILFLPILLLLGCEDEWGRTHRPLYSSTPVLLDAEVDGTRGLVVIEDNTLFTMGVFAGYEDDNETFGASSVANDFINNVKYQRSMLTHPFAGGDVCYWPFSGKLSFFAYAPYISDQYLRVAPNYTGGYPRMTYTPTTDVSNQPDFCIANPVLDQHLTTEPIPLHFHHALCQVLFSANYAGELPNGNLYVKIDSIRICHVIGKKQVAMSNGSPCFTWQADAECPESDRCDYKLRRGGLSAEQHLSDVALPEATSPATDNFMNLSTGNGRLYLLPQAMIAGAIYLRVTYGFYEMVGTEEVLRAATTTVCPLPAANWLPTYTYRYKFTIDLADNCIVNPTVTVDLWQNVNNTQANPIHIE